MSDKTKDVEQALHLIQLATCTTITQEEADFVVSVLYKDDEIPFDGALSYEDSADAYALRHPGALM